MRCSAACRTSFRVAAWYGSPSDHVNRTKTRPFRSRHQYYNADVVKKPDTSVSTSPLIGLLLHKFLKHRDYSYCVGLCYLPSPYSVEHEMSRKFSRGGAARARGERAVGLEQRRRGGGSDAFFQSSVPRLPAPLHTAPRNTRQPVFGKHISCTGGLRFTDCVIWHTRAHPANWPVRGVPRDAPVAGRLLPCMMRCSGACGQSAWLTVESRSASGRLKSIKPTRRGGGAARNCMRRGARRKGG